LVGGEGGGGVGRRREQTWTSITPGTTFTKGATKDNGSFVFLGRPTSHFFPLRRRETTVSCRPVENQRKEKKRVQKEGRLAPKKKKFQNDPADNCQTIQQKKKKTGPGGD